MGSTISAEKIHREIAEALRVEGLEVDLQFLPERARQSSLEPMGTGYVRVPHRREDQDIKLTPSEFKLFLLLYENADQVCTRDDIVRGVWGQDYIDKVDNQRIDKLVSRLRKKIEPNPSEPRYILTERGYGYKLEQKVAD